MRIQPVQTNYRVITNRNTAERQNNKQPAFNGTLGKINGAVKGSMIGAFGWAVCSAALPFLAPAVIAGAVVFGAIDDKLENMANKDKKD